MRYRLCIFDLDGTLIDSQSVIRTALQNTARELGVASGVLHSSALPIGLPLTDILQQLGFRDVEHARAVYRKYYYHLLHLEKPFPGVPELLARLHHRVLLALATNKSFDGTQATLRHTGLSVFFDVIETIDRGNPKPDKDAFERISDFYRRQGTLLQPQDCLMVGDSPVDMEFAHNAGIDAAFAAWGFYTQDQLTTQPAYIVATPRELYAAVAHE